LRSFIDLRRPSLDGNRNRPLSAPSKLPDSALLDQGAGSAGAGLRAALRAVLGRLMITRLPVMKYAAEIVV
jgi:hypothetical protein